MLHCPASFLPQATTWPSLRKSTEWRPPAETWVYDRPSSKGGMSHCPSELSPQETALPSFRRRSVWRPPVETWVYDMSLSNGGMSNCLSPRLPQATAVPSLRRSTVCLSFAETWVYVNPSSKSLDRNLIYVTWTKIQKENTFPNGGWTSGKIKNKHSSWSNVGIGNVACIHMFKVPPSHDLTITSKQNPMGLTDSNLDVGHARIQGWNAALFKLSSSTHFHSQDCTVTSWLFQFSTRPL